MNYNPVPPQNPEAERSVLGTLLQDQEAVITAIETLKSQVAARTFVQVLVYKYPSLRHERALLRVYIALASA